VLDFGPVADFHQHEGRVSDCATEDAQPPESLTLQTLGHRPSVGAQRPLLSTDSALDWRVLTAWSQGSLLPWRSVAACSDSRCAKLAFADVDEHIAGAGGMSGGRHRITEAFSFGLPRS
jgi:hypothetical protein